MDQILVKINKALKIKRQSSLKTHLVSSRVSEERRGLKVL